MHQCKKLPLRIDLTPRSQREALQSMRMQVAEHRLDDPQAPAVEQSPCAAVDSVLHCRRIRMRVMGFPAVEERDLPIRAGIGLAHALGLDRAMAADHRRALETHTVAPFDDDVGRAELEALSVRTDAGFVRFVIFEVLARKPLRAVLAGLALLLRWLVPIRFGEAWIALSEIGIGDQRIDLQVGHLLQAGLGVVARITQHRCTEQRIGRFDRNEILPDLPQHFR